MLKILRNKAKLTQNKLAFLSGVSVSTIQRIESGSENVNYISVKKLAEFFETDINTIMEKEKR
ncbi:helix-turn-helix transcriptional regulator [Clostridium sp.]|jgi:transcriptional regulator with XRE-family HTH domain|uniref:helix-turn-helix domain-containing protein n=1 Tax=Clostridium sp. TaxID=1506 RepID=UPI0029147D2B|nr:helix-turn-helix transcriptional regulator [Clostridium sp.]MDU7215836.1 helix-turn-helix transcriptional regulator [Clostridium sp.]MDU7238124.1 helix-turn-helix transcriptional regulator [Clostridium perfringens]